MQRQFTMELRVDYEDNGKTEELRKAFQQAGRHVYAVAALLADQTKPQIAIFSDDFYSGHEEIELLDDTIAIGKEQIAGSAEQQVSSELLAALREDK